MSFITGLAPNYVKVCQKILKHKDIILNGTVLAIDPASKDMGYCLAVNGEVVKNGVWQAVPSRGVSKRLAQIGDMGRKDMRSEMVDLVLVEKVRTSTGNYMLVNSVGTAYDIANAKYAIEIPTYLWKKVIDADYYKDDAMDSLYMWKLAYKVCTE